MGQRGRNEGPPGDRARWVIETVTTSWLVVPKRQKTKCRIGWVLLAGKLMAQDSIHPLRMGWSAR